jgi:hypothetical protein
VPLGEFFPVHTDGRAPHANSVWPTDDLPCFEQFAALDARCSWRRGDVMSCSEGVSREVWWLPCGAFGVGVLCVP